MKKKEFEQAVRNKLRKVPLETRMTWKDADLFLWWLKAKAEDSYLTWEQSPCDLWQFVPGKCVAISSVRRPCDKRLRPAPMRGLTMLNWRIERIYA